MYGLATYDDRPTTMDILRAPGAQPETLGTTDRLLVHSAGGETIARLTNPNLKLRMKINSEQ